MKYAFVLAILLLALPVLAATPLSGQSGTQTPLFQTARGAVYDASSRLVGSLGCAVPTNAVWDQIMLVLFGGIVLAYGVKALGGNDAGADLALALSNGIVFFGVLDCQGIMKFALFFALFGTEAFLNHKSG